MARVLLLHNTEKYHYGSAQAMQYIMSQLDGHDVVSDPSSKKLKVSDYDAVVLNGEGSLHSSDQRSKISRWLGYCNEAVSQGKPALLVNSVWQNNSQAVTEMLKDLTYVGVREKLSANEIRQWIDRDIDICPDYSFYGQVPVRDYDHVEIMAGNRYALDPELIQGIGETGHVDIFKDPWDVLVNKLRNAEILVTGRHHEMYAACVARCRFVVFEGNSHKNSGLMATFGSNIPVLDPGADRQEIDSAIQWARNNPQEYQQLFDAMSSIERPQWGRLIKETLHG